MFNNTVPHQGLPRPAHKRVRERIREIAADLEREFPELIAQSPVGFKRLVAACLKQNLPPRAGRPRKENVTRALRLEREGKSRLEIFVLCIPNFSTLRRASRVLEQRNLLSAMRGRKRTKSRQ